MQCGKIRELKWWLLSDPKHKKIQFLDGGFVVFADRGISGTGTESRVPGTRAGLGSRVLGGRDRVHINRSQNVKK